MAADHTEEGTLAPGEAHAEGGLPQMNVDTYASQIFWLVVTFTFLMVVLSRVAMPNIRGGLERRQNKIQGDLDAAQELGKQAAESLEAYEASLASARGRALALEDESRRKVLADIETQKDEAEAKSQAAMAEAEQRIAAARKSAAENVRKSAAGAAADVVERLIGERVSEADADKAVEAAL
jgi:F-type H+-transporting ATPase subunit b